jgi:hypothetical protein
MEKQMGAGTILSMGPSTAPKEGCNGLGQVGIPSSYEGDHALGVSPWLYPRPAIMWRKSDLR